MLELRGVAAGYGESLIVHDVDLSVGPGEVACLMGRNGAGKTTLIKTIVGLLPARRGTVRLDEVDLTRAEPHRRARAGIGYVPQGRGIFPYLSVRENLLMGFEAVGRVEPGALDEVHEQFPVLARIAARTAGTLSGGQHRELLLLDEPSEGIQPSIVQEIEALVQALRAGRETSILLVEQFLDFALAVADRYYVMENGTIVAQGIGAELADHTVREHLAV
jgi:urea transport system ATP-binding protein